MKAVGFPILNGHINDTYRVTIDNGDEFILQRINSYVFKQPVKVMENIKEITLHMRGKLFSFFKRIDSKMLYFLVKGFDSYVLLTDQMKMPLGIQDKPYVVVEGAVDVTKASVTIKDDGSDNKRVILYTGNLNSRNGINNLLTAFDLIRDEDFELWICGEGDEEERIRTISQNNNRVKYYGLVSKERVYELQNKATVLVNPRQADSGEYTKYSFPSKTMEYLLSGKPVVAYKLEGIPSEYDDHIVYVKDNTIQELADTLYRVCTLTVDHRTRLGQRGREFVLQNKSGVAQARKILEMINNTNED